MIFRLWMRKSTTSDVYTWNTTSSVNSGDLCNKSSCVCVRRRRATGRAVAAVTRRGRTLAVFTVTVASQPSTCNARSTKRRSRVPEVRASPWHPCRTTPKWRHRTGNVRVYGRGHRVVLWACDRGRPAASSITMIWSRRYAGFVLQFIPLLIGLTIRGYRVPSRKAINMLGAYQAYYPFGVVYTNLRF